jgi:hypothetical protein
VNNLQELIASRTEAENNGFANPFGVAMGSDSAFHNAPTRKSLAGSRLREASGAPRGLGESGAQACGPHLMAFGGLSRRRNGLWNFNS